MALKLGELVAYLKADNTHLAKGMKAAEGKMRQLGERAKQHGPVLGAALAAGIGAGLVEGLHMDAARAKLTARVGDPALAQSIGEAAGRVYARGFGESADQVMEATQAVVSSHLAAVDDAGAIERMTVKVQAYASAWGTDVATAAQYASTLIGSGLVRDADHAMDLITAASKRVPIALREDVLETADEYGQFFRTLGFDGEQAFALLTAASKKGGISIDKTGDALKEFTALATDMSTSSVDAYKAIGLNAKTMSNQILAGGDTAHAALQKITAGLLSIKDPTEQATAAIALFGTPLEDLNVADIPGFLHNLAAVGDGFDGVAGASDKASKKLEDTTIQRLLAFKRTILVALGDMLGWLSRNSDWVVPLATGLGILAGVIGTIIVVTKAWVAVQTALNVVMALSPIGWIVLGIIALVAAIVWIATKTTWFQDLWSAAWGGIKAAAEWVLNWIVDGWEWAIGILASGARTWWSLFSGTWRKVGELGRAVFDWIVDKGSTWLRWVAGLPGRVGRATWGLFDGLKAAFKSALNWIIGKWNRLSFRIPGVSVPGLGQVWGGATLSTPNIPYLAKGGTALAPGLAVVGERGPEVAYLNRGATIQPLGAGTATTTPGRLLLTGEFRVRGGDLVLVLREQVAGRGGNVQQVIGSNQ
ncbi:phage tail tape measure protein [Salinispora cortesiana]|uniref:phage tail tape measure protein n=1 Tax=Salinispora cortesiana TaxID=1305843 RepID=UPI000404F5B0|nr:phage tail tape measure protein [Salinispora cortesiana]